MLEFFQTRMGTKFYEGSVPRIAQALEEIAGELKRANDLKECELNEDEPPTLGEVAREFVGKSKKKATG